MAVQRGELPRAGRALLFVKNDSNLTGWGLFWDHNNRAGEVRRKFPSPLKRAALRVWSRFPGGPRLLSCRGDANVKPLLLACLSHHSCWTSLGASVKGGAIPLLNSLCVFFRTVSRYCWEVSLSPEAFCEWGIGELWL